MLFCSEWIQAIWDRVFAERACPLFSTPCPNRQGWYVLRSGRKQVHILYKEVSVHPTTCLMATQHWQKARFVFSATAQIEALGCVSGQRNHFLCWQMCWASITWNHVIFTNETSPKPSVSQRLVNNLAAVYAMHAWRDELGSCCATHHLALLGAVACLWKWPEQRY
jgi:hypothetical protein